MPKRAAETAPQGTQKRVKLQDASSESLDGVKSVRHLQQCLAFLQDNGPQQRKGINAFKTFLESILYPEDKNATLRPKTILKEFLESQISKQGNDGERTFLPDLMSIWSFASQANNESLQSAVSSVIALLLKTISTLIDFREYGIQLSKTVLQQAQLKLISRGLAAPKHKEHLISPCLRLLTEVVSFDGGAMARNVFATKTFTLDPKVLARNLSLWKAEAEDKEEARRKPSVRSNTVRYILANFKFQSSQVKGEMLRYGNMTRSLFDHVRHDPPDLLKELFDVLKTSVLADTAVPRMNKGYLLNEHNLSSIASIYRQEQSPNQVNAEHSRTEVLAHEFLLFICTDASAGILRPFADWYPPGSDKRQADHEQDNDDTLEIDLGLSSIDWYERYHKHVPVRNTILAGFAQTLRPYADLRESELLITIFQSAPELVADYFFKKVGFAFDPKLTSTWIGYSAFLFSVVQLPTPQYLGGRDSYNAVPPPVSIVIESILPQPLNQKVLTRCLNQQCELITFFGIRLLVVAFQKLQRVLAHFSSAATEHGSLWEEAASRLIAEFVSRCPKMKDVIGAFRKTGVEKTLQREASLRLLLLYYEVTPQIAFEEKFDVSIALADAMNAFNDVPSQDMSTDETEGNPTENGNLRLLELSHLLQIARWSPDMRWWHKPESLRFAPFTSLLKVMATMPREKIPDKMQQLLKAIISEHDILQHQTQDSAPAALLVSLVSDLNWRPSDALFDFLDDAFARLSRKPIKYLDNLDALTQDISIRQPVSLLLLTLQEQWPFAAKTEASLNIAGWLSRLLKAFEFIGEDKTVLMRITTNLMNDCETEEQRIALQDVDTSGIQTLLTAVQNPQGSHIGNYQNPTISISKSNFISDTASLSIELAIFAASSSTDSDPTPLHRLGALSPTEAIISSQLPTSILLLSSPDLSISRLALTTLATLHSRLTPPNASTTSTTTSQPSDTPQFHLLLGILTTTSLPYIKSSTPVPYFCTTYAALAAEILAHPLHPLYERVCRFHTRAPRWDVERMPSWWAHQLLYTMPGDTSTTATPGEREATGMQNGHDPTSSILSFLTPPGLVPLAHKSTTTPSTPHSAGLTFLLTYLYASLRTPADLAILRKRGTLEPILALAGSTGARLPRGCTGLVLALLWRCTSVDGGSTMLVTRKGIVAWLGGRIALTGGRSGRGGAASVGVKRVGVREDELDGRGDEEGEDETAENENGNGDKQVRPPSENELGSMEGLKALLRRVWETCDRERVDTWSGGMMEGIIKDLLAT